MQLCLVISFAMYNCTHTHTTWKFNHEKQSIRMGFAKHFSPFPSLPVSQLFPFNRTKTIPITKHFSSLVLSFSLSLSLSLSLVYGCLIFNAACNRMTFKTFTFIHRLYQSNNDFVQISTRQLAVHRFSTTQRKVYVRLLLDRNID